MASAHAIRRPLLIAALAVVLTFVAIVRIRLLDVPLERDEGEYAYAGQLMLQGTPPYSLAYNMKFPGIYAAYSAVLAVFGESTAGIHRGLLLVNCAAIVLVFALALRLFGSIAGVVAACTYALLSMSPSVLGLAAHATHFVVVPALGGILLLMRARETDNPWMFLLGGVTLGLAPLVKQHGAVFPLFGLAFVAFAARRGCAGGRARGPASVALYSIGALLPLGLTCAALAGAGVFDRFWFWTISYAAQYAAQRPLVEAWPALVRGLAHVVETSPLLWLLAACGAIGTWWSREHRGRAVFVSALVAFSALGVLPGFYFRRHYFIVLLPAVAILAGAAVEMAAVRLPAGKLFPRLRYALPVLLFAIPAGHTIWLEGQAWFELSPHEVSRFVYGTNPFPEALAIGRYISEHSSPADRIAVLGSEPEIYFHSGRRSAAGHIYTYPLMEPHPYARRMQEEMIREIETASPKYLVFVNGRTSWLKREDSEALILEWVAPYTKEHYALAGIVEILDSGETVYRWDADAVSYVPRSPNKAYVYRRIDGRPAAPESTP